MARVKLGEVAREYKETCKGSKTGLRAVGLEHLEPENIALTQWDTSSDNTFTKLFYEGQMLFGRRRAYLKKAAMASFDGICSGDITVIEANPERLLPNLMPFIIQSNAFFDFAVEGSAGSLSPRVKWEHLSQHEFELPPLEEQAKLAEVLWAFEKTKSAYKTLLASTEDLVQAQFIEMFGDPTTNFTKWGQLPLKDACDRLNDGPFGSNLKSEHYTQEGVRVIRLQNIGVGIFLNEDKAFVSSKHYEKIKKYTCRAGDIVIGTLGEPNLRACIVPDGIPLAINTADCVHCVPKSDLLVNKFVCQYLNSPSTLRLASSMIHGQTRGRISSGQIAKLPIPIPPISLQVQFATFAESTVNSNYALQQSLSALDQARNALMEKTFR